MKSKITLTNMILLIFLRERNRLNSSKNLSFNLSLKIYANSIAVKE